ncbi:MAG: AAA family ATPase [Armatimonadota bacterium]
MLTKLRIKNFKCFEDTGEVELRPLTVLVGPNPLGKSSLRTLLALKQTVESLDLSIAFIPVLLAPASHKLANTIRPNLRHT